MIDDEKFSSSWLELVKHVLPLLEDNNLLLVSSQCLPITCFVHLNTGWLDEISYIFSVHGKGAHSSPTYFIKETYNVYLGVDPQQITN